MSRDMLLGLLAAQPRLAVEDAELLARVAGALPILADLSRADVYEADGPDAVVIAHQARPHSVPPIRLPDQVGRRVQGADAADIVKALRRGHRRAGLRRHVRDAAPVVQVVYPIRGGKGAVLGALSVEKTLIEHERHRRRSPYFRRAISHLQDMVLYGALRCTERLAPFGEHDGILVIQPNEKIVYASGIANNLYRRLGIGEMLPGKLIWDLGTGEAGLAARAVAEGQCLEEEAEEGARIWVRKAIPLVEYPRLGVWPRDVNPAGAIITIHDETEARRKAQELKVQSAMMQEIQHRVKNSLQTIIALLRLQARRASSEETRRTLEESINRILSVAAVHEFLFQPDSRVVNIRVLAERVLNQITGGMIDPEKHIRLELQGPDVHLPPQQATPCALVINELVQNAIEHGYEGRAGGTISIRLHDEGHSIAIVISDDGAGLPAGFDLNQASSLGLRIVQSLVEDGLRGQLTMTNDHGVSATVRFPKQTEA